LIVTTITQLAQLMEAKARLVADVETAFDRFIETIARVECHPIPSTAQPNGEPFASLALSVTGIGARFVNVLNAHAPQITLSHVGKVAQTA
jgi:hypothetical protein